MWKNFINRITLLKRAAGIEIIPEQDGVVNIHITIVSLQGNSILVERQVSGLKNINDLTGIINKNIPVALVINGRGVLIKKETGNHTGKAVQDALPNVNPAEFLLQSLPAIDGEIINIVRRDSTLKIVHELEKLNYQVLTVFPGLSAIHFTLPYLVESGLQQISTDNLVLKIKPQTGVSDFLHKEQKNLMDGVENELLIGNQYVKGCNLISFSAAAGLLATGVSKDNSFSEQLLGQERNEYRYYKLFIAAGWASLLLVLGLLIINFLFYNHYYSLNKTSEVNQGFSDQLHRNFEKLEREVRRKEKFLERSGWVKPGRTSYYTDRIAALVPSSVSLLNLSVYPQRSSPGEFNSLQFKADTISVSGKTDDAVELNTFLNSLRLLDDFREVSVKNYQLKNENGLFTLELIIK